jgi:hypothetical protein
MSIADLAEVACWPRADPQHGSTSCARSQKHRRAETRKSANLCRANQLIWPSSIKAFAPPAREFREAIYSPASRTAFLKRINGRGSGPSLMAQGVHV